jgi:hypothetical protein
MFTILTVILMALTLVFTIYALDISQTSIEAFFEISKTNPKINYKLYFGAKNKFNFSIVEQR